MRRPCAWLLVPASAGTNGEKNSRFAKNRDHWRNVNFDELRRQRSRRMTTWKAALTTSMKDFYGAMSGSTTRRRMKARRPTWWRRPRRRHESAAPPARCDGEKRSTDSCRNAGRRRLFRAAAHHTFPSIATLSLLYRDAGGLFGHRTMIDLHEPDQLFSPQVLGPDVPPILGGRILQEPFFLMKAAPDR